MGGSWAVGSNVFVSGKIRTLDGGRGLNLFFFYGLGCFGNDNSSWNVYQWCGGFRDD